MIPYDDLVIALQTWRGRQGLPVAQLSGIHTAPPPVAEPAKQPSGPAPRAKAGSPPIDAVPPPLAPIDTSDEDVDDAALLEEAHYENEGDDFAMAFQGLAPETDHESTSIGSAPPPVPAGQRDSFGGSTEPEPPADKLNRNDDW